MLPQAQTKRVSATELRKVCAELERRLSAGEACSAETILAVDPDFTDDADAALELIYTEFVTKEQLGQKPDAADFFKRFPQWQCDLEQLFEIHQAAGSTSAVLPTP